MRARWVLLCPATTRGWIRPGDMGSATPIDQSCSHSQRFPWLTAPSSAQSVWVFPYGDQVSFLGGGVRSVMTSRRASRRKAKERAALNEGGGGPAGDGRQRMWIGDQPVGFGELMAEADQISTTVDDEGRVLFVDDPAVGMGAVVTGLSPSGEPVADGTADQVPVALFEPRKAMMIRQQDGRLREAQAEAAVTLGLRPFLAGFVTLERAAGWVLRRLPGNSGLELVDSTGSVFSRIQHLLTPEWVSAAVSYGDVLVLYGTSIGVRVPEGVTEAGYLPAKRAAELKQSRELGTVAAGYVRWVG